MTGMPYWKLLLLLPFCLNVLACSDGRSQPAGGVQQVSVEVFEVGKRYMAVVPGLGSGSTFKVLEVGRPGWIRAELDVAGQQRFGVTNPVWLNSDQFIAVNEIGSQE